MRNIRRAFALLLALLSFAGAAFAEAEETLSPDTVLFKQGDKKTEIKDIKFRLYELGYYNTTNLNRGLRMSERLESGMVGLNQGVVSNPAAPFGGIKESGLGREGGTVGIEEFLETKYIGIAVAD